MFKFPHPLFISTSVHGQTHLAFDHKRVAIHDPLTSPCGSGPCDPSVYGLTIKQASVLIELNVALQKALAPEAPRPHEHPEFPRSAWADAVATGDAVSPYWEWTTLQQQTRSKREPGPIVPSKLFVTIPTGSGGTALTSTTVLGEGRVLVTGVGGLYVPQSLDDDVLRITVQLAGEHAAARLVVVAGREGMNRWYEHNVGYRPDLEEPSMRTEELLHQLVTVLFGHVTGYCG